MVYLDYAATAPVEPAAVDAMAAAASEWANPSSVHGPGRAARAALEDARRRIAAALGWDGELILTGGGTEAIGLALGRARAGVRLVSAVEHSAVLGAAGEAVRLPVDGAGRVELGALERLLADAGPRPLVAVMQANNETGVVQPLTEVARRVRAAGGVLLADCVQSAGRMALPDADLIAVSAHKLGGPPGVGALLVRDLGLLEAAGAGQERGYRAGTENLPGAAGFAAALEARAADTGWTERVRGLRERLEAGMAAAGGVVLGAEAERLPHIACVALPGVDAMMQLMALDLEGFAVSAGSACSSGRVKASHVLSAMGLSERAAGEAIRVSPGWRTTEEQVDSFARAYAAMAARLRRVAA